VRILDMLDKTMTTPGDRELLRQTVAANGAYIKGQEELFKLIQSGPPAEAQHYLVNQFRPVLRNFKNLVAELVKTQNELANSAGERAEATYSDTHKLMIGLSTAILVLSGLLAYWISASITRPLARALALANTVAEGDLSTQFEVRGKDELGQLLAALKRMNDNLARTVSTVRSSTDTIATAASEVAAGNQDLSARTEQQAGSLEETAAAMEELTSTVRQNADNARQAHVLAGAASNVPSAAATSSPAWCRRWARSTAPRTKSPTSSA
jgi:methyl-accepting chemotaxis protein